MSTGTRVTDGPDYRYALIWWTKDMSMSSSRCAGPPARREFLQAGALALGGATLSQILAGRSAAGA